jgi:hypothetical protein
VPNHRHAGRFFRDVLDGGATWPARDGKAGSGGTARKRVTYTVDGERRYEPMHAEFQARFLQHLKRKKASVIKENDGYVDVSYKLGDVTRIAELKPCGDGDARFAAREAVGQVLEYAHARGAARDQLEIVLGAKPRKLTIDFLLSEGIRVTYEEPQRKGVFKTREPKKRS